MWRCFPRGLIEGEDPPECWHHHPMNWGTEINEKEARRKCEQRRSSLLPDIPYTTGPDASLLSPSVLPWWLYILDCWSRGDLFSLKLPPVRNLVTIVRETILSLGHTQLRWYHIKTGLLSVSPCFRAMLNLCRREGIWLFLPWLGQRTFPAIAELCLGRSPGRGGFSVPCHHCDFAVHALSSGPAIWSQSSHLFDHTIAALLFSNHRKDDSGPLVQKLGF